MPRNPGDGYLQKSEVWQVKCGESCGHGIEIHASTKKEAETRLRQTLDWSKGRDGIWRCKKCRPRRFGETVTEFRGW